MPSRETDRGARDKQREVLRRIGPAGRVEIAFEMSREAREIALAGMRRRNPRLSEAEARLRLLRRVLGDALCDAAYRPPGA